jgi:hypothetical protein
MRYWLFALLTIPAALLGTVLWMINPVTGIFNWLGGWGVQLVGRQPPFDSDYTATFVLCFVWPLLAAPSHYLAYRVLGWKAWGFLAVWAGWIFLAAFAIQLWRSYR